MPKKSKKKPEGFTSIKMIGSKAQNLWEKARSRIQQNDDDAAILVPPKKKHEEILMHISGWSIAKAMLIALAVLVSAWLMFLLRDKLILLLLAIFLALVLDPAVRFLESWGLPRGVAVIFMYFIFIALAVFLIASLIPIVAVQIQNLGRLINAQADAFLANPEISVPFLPMEYNRGLTSLAQETLRNLDIQDKTSFLEQYGADLQTQVRNVVTFAVGFTSQVAAFFLSFAVVMVLAFFIQLEKEKIMEYFRILFPHSYRNYFDHKSEAIHRKMSQWITGQLTLCVAIATLVFVALYILGMGEYALTLALLAGFTEFIPVAGPIIAAVPAVLIAFTQEGFVWGLVVAAVYYAIQWCENNLLVPLIMRRAVGLSPIAILFAMLVGISFPRTIHPILGVILSVPITTIIAIFLQDLREYRRRSPE